MTTIKKKKTLKALQVCSVCCIAIAMLSIAIAVPFAVSGEDVANAEAEVINYFDSPVELSYVGVDDNFAVSVDIYAASFNGNLGLVDGESYNLYLDTGAYQTVQGNTSYHYGPACEGSQVSLTYALFDIDGNAVDGGLSAIHGIEELESFILVSVIENCDFTYQSDGMMPAQLCLNDTPGSVTVLMYVHGVLNASSPYKVLGLSDGDVVLDFSEPEEFGAGGIVNNVVGGFTTFLTGTGEGIANFFESIFVKEGGGLSVMAIVFLSLMGLGLATGLLKVLLNRFSV